MSLDQTPINQLITDNIDTWTSTVKTKSASGRGSSKKRELYGVKKLRELILELAVRGKLVPQDPTDEPASVLLERIAVEKAQLVKDKKIKKQKALPEISEQDVPFLAPVGWEWTRLDDLVEVLDSRRKPISKKDRVSGPYPYYGASGIVDFVDDYIFDENLILIGEDGAKWGKGDNTAFPVTGKSWVNNHVHVVRGIHSGLVDQFLVYSLVAQDLNEYITGITVPKLNQARLRTILVAVPCEAEQKRIVAKVDELMILCDQLVQQTEASIEAHQVLVTTLLDTLTNSANAEELMQNWQMVAEHFDTLFTTEESIDQLKQTILQLAVMGKLVNIGEKKETLLKSVLTFGPRNGFSPKESSTETQLKVLKLGATSYGVLDLKQSKFIDVDISDKPYLYINQGDILIQRGNSANFVGSNVLIQESYSDYIYPDLMMKLRVNDEVLPEYVSLLLSSKFSREHMWSQMTGTSGTMPKISKKVVEGVPIMFPVCLAVQKTILEKYNELIGVCELLMARLNFLEYTKVNLTDAIVEQAV
ncbi:restriction endonuclease subunit S [Vibrio parahaemolyticus]|nr:restriction endonuclease subunit S [Vibrio parahaemolyticus]